MALCRFPMQMMASRAADGAQLSVHVCLSTTLCLLRYGARSRAFHCTPRSGSLCTFMPGRSSTSDQYSAPRQWTASGK